MFRSTRPFGFTFTLSVIDDSDEDFDDIERICDKIEQYFKPHLKKYEEFKTQHPNKRIYSKQEKAKKQKQRQKKKQDKEKIAREAELKQKEEELRTKALESKKKQEVKAEQERKHKAADAKLRSEIQNAVGHKRKAPEQELKQETRSNKEAKYAESKESVEEEISQSASRPSVDVILTYQEEPHSMITKFCQAFLTPEEEREAWKQVLALRQNGAFKSDNGTSRECTSFADEGAQYTFNFEEHPGSTEWPAIFVQIRKKAEEVTGHPLNHLLINLYRNEKVGVGWHSDKERDIKPEHGSSLFLQRDQVFPDRILRR